MINQWCTRLFRLIQFYEPTFSNANTVKRRKYWLQTHLKNRKFIGSYLCQRLLLMKSVWGVDKFHPRSNHPNHIFARKWNWESWRREESCEVVVNLVPYGSDSPGQQNRQVSSTRQLVQHFPPLHLQIHKLKGGNLWKNKNIHLISNILSRLVYIIEYLHRWHMSAQTEYLQL